MSETKEVVARGQYLSLAVTALAEDEEGVRSYLAQVVDKLDAMIGPLNADLEMIWGTNPVRILP